MSIYETLAKHENGAAVMMGIYRFPVITRKRFSKQKMCCFYNKFCMVTTLWRRIAYIELTHGLKFFSCFV